MIVHHPHGLHEGVADRAAYEREASPLQVLAHGVRFRGLGRDFLDRPPGVLPRLVADESPNVLSNVPMSSCTARNALAFWTAASIFSRLRTIPLSDNKLWHFLWPYLATATGSKLS